MAFLIPDLFGGGPTATVDEINPGQAFGSSGFPGAPAVQSVAGALGIGSSSVSLNSGITFQPPSTSTSRFGDPNLFGPPADVTYPGTIPANPFTGGLLQALALPGPTSPASTTTTTPTTTTKTTSDATTDAINRLIDLASQQGQGGGGGGGIVALPTGIASSGGTSGGGLSLGTVALIIAVIALGAYFWHKHNKSKASGHHASA